MGRAAEWRERWRHIDPLAPLVGVTALTVYALHGLDGHLPRDLGIYAYGGQQVANGVPPYVGILNRVGPLGHLLPGLGVVGARVGGFDDMRGIQLLYLIISVACVCLVYVVGRELFASRLAGLAATAAFLSFFGFIHVASTGPRDKTPMVLFVLCVLLAVVRQRWFVAGLFVGLATLTWQPAFFVAVTAAVVAPLALRPAAALIRALVAVVAGGLVTVLVCVAYFAAAGALREFIDAFLLISARYAHATRPTSDPEIWTHLHKAYGDFVWVIAVGLAAMLIVAGMALVLKGRRQDPMRMFIIAVGTASVVGLVWSSQVLNNWPDVFVLLPLAALGIGGIAKELSTRVSARVALPLTLAWVVVGVAAAGHYSVSTREDGLDDQRESVQAVIAALPPGASILSIEAPQPLVLSGRTNPSRHQIFVGPLGRYIEDTWPGGLRGYAAWIGREQTTVVALQRGPVPEWLTETLRTQYARVGAAPGWQWYLHRSVAESIRSQLRRDLAPY
ncbi:MAG: hypothetical protein GEU93_08475 [Propionibacteriales bacterium]|nr:hypothetical protein [Propionibacteriales bacterium]